MRPRPRVRVATPPRTAVRRLALGRAVSAAGTFAAGTALTYTIYRETQSAAWISATMLLTWAVVGFFSPHIDRRLGILISLVVLAVPTTLLASAPNLTVFTVLRIAQGLCMASAFALTLAYLGEQCSAMDAGGAFAAYITGNVASNLVGRLVSAAVADTLGPLALPITIDHWRAAIR